MCKFYARRKYQTFSSLHFGGAEKALVNLFDTMNYDVYEIDLLLLSDEGKLLNIVNNKVNIIHPDLITRNLYYANLNLNQSGQYG